MAFERVIVFGPTGNIGSVAAQTASKKGATVYLAMRDPKKAIPGLTKEAEESGFFLVSRSLSPFCTPKGAPKYLGRS